jgi:hypothetical protein
MRVQDLINALDAEVEDHEEGESLFEMNLEKPLLIPIQRPFLSSRSLSLRKTLASLILGQIL